MLTIGNPNDEGSVGTGLAIGLGINIAVFVVALAVVTGSNGISSPIALFLFWPAMAIGLTQLVYIVPLYLRYRKTGQKNTAKGLVIAASITALLNASCWGVLSSLQF